jgi:carboxylate-amine ligase
MRYGVKDTLFDFGRAELVPFDQLMEEMLALIAEDAAAAGCEREVAHARRIIRDGTSADRQVALFQGLLEKGATRREALQGVVQHLVTETMSGLR